MFTIKVCAAIFLASGLCRPHLGHRELGPANGFAFGPGTFQRFLLNRRQPPSDFNHFQILVVGPVDFPGFYWAWLP